MRRDFTLEDLDSAFGRFTTTHRQRQFIVVDPDVYLAQVIASELRQATQREFGYSACTTAVDTIAPETCVVVTEASKARADYLGKVDVRTIRFKSLQELVKGRQRPVSPVLVGFVSRSVSILRWAGTLLSALGFPSDSVILGNANYPEWQRGLASCDIVASDIVTSSELTGSMTSVIVRVLSEAFVSEMHSLCGLHQSPKQDPCSGHAMTSV